jgi:aryl-alcohol dehydrogenase-like predicted oxidoreductase
MGIVIGSPLQMGAYSPANEDEVRQGPIWLSPPRQQQFCALYDFAREIDIALPELALRFVLSDPRVSCALMGARSPAEVEENAAAVARGPLSSEVLARLDEIAAMVPFRPCEEPFVLPLGRNYPGLGQAR